VAQKLERSPDDELLTAEQAGKVLQVPARYIARELRGQIPVVRLGRRVRYWKSDLLRLAEARTEPAIRPGTVRRPRKRNPNQRRKR
jgi:hypothetical protein